MAECSIIINVSDQEYRHGAGMAGFQIIPPKPPDAPFSMMVVYPTPEIQDIGDNRTTTHWLKSRPLAQNICGMHTDQPLTKWGVLLCEAELDMPKSLEKAIEAEHIFLNENPAQHTHRLQVINGSKVMVAVNIDGDDIKNQKRHLSEVVLYERENFETACRKQIKKEEIAKAIAGMHTEYGRLIVDADQLWAKGPDAQRDISDLHRRACRAMGQERPWCYTAFSQFPCPGCGKPCRDRVITCPSCGAIFDRDIEEYEHMSNAEKARALYPERYAVAEPTHSINVETGAVKKK